MTTRTNKNGGLEEMVWKNYVITTAQRGAKPHVRFLEGLEQYAANNNAEIIVLPTNGIITKSAKEDDDEVLHERFSQGYRIVEKDYKLNKGISIRHFPVKAQQMDPTTSWDRFVGTESSAIMPSPKQRMRIVPNSNTDEPKVLMSTGAVTHPHYKDNSWGEKARLDHVYGALTVSIEDDGRYHYRQLRANQKGVFYDLGIKYNGYNNPVYEGAEALIMGDYHCAEIEPKVLEASHRMIEELQPKRLFLHDFFDGFSISHHDKGRAVTKAIKRAHTVEDELRQCGEHLAELRRRHPGTQIYVVKSNHDEVLDRWLQEGRFMNEPQNTKIGLYLMDKLIDGKDPLQEGIKRMYGTIKGVRFLDRDDDYKVRGWQLANHGDLGANGARASPRSLEAACSKQIVGHAHTPQIWRNLFIVGTSTPLKIEYNRGPSGWLNTHAALYANGQPQLINIIKGKYK